MFNALKKQINGAVKMKVFHFGVEYAHSNLHTLRKTLSLSYPSIKST